RDQTDQRIYLKRDEERLIWQFEKSESELWKEKPDPLLEVIADFINSNNGEWSGTPTELAKILAGDIQPNALSMMLNVRAGKLFEEYQICYEKDVIIVEDIKTFFMRKESVTTVTAVTVIDIAVTVVTADTTVGNFFLLLLVK
ncbi:hypothetical protein OBE_11743, partial [human gut metagenome]